MHDNMHCNNFPALTSLLTTGFRGLAFKEEFFLDWIIIVVASFFGTLGAITMLFTKPPIRPALAGLPENIS